MRAEAASSVGDSSLAFPSLSLLLATVGQTHSLWRWWQFLQTGWLSSHLIRSFLQLKQPFLLFLCLRRLFFFLSSSSELAVVGPVVSSCWLASAGGAADTDATSEDGSAADPDESVVSFGDLGYG